MQGFDLITEVTIEETASVSWICSSQDCKIALSRVDCMYGRKYSSECMYELSIHRRLVQLTYWWYSMLDPHHMSIKTGEWQRYMKSCPPSHH